MDLYLRHWVACEVSGPTMGPVLYPLCRPPAQPTPLTAFGGRLGVNCDASQLSWHERILLKRSAAPFHGALYEQHGRERSTACAQGGERLALCGAIKGGRQLRGAYEQRRAGVRASRSRLQCAIARAHTDELH